MIVTCLFGDPVEHSVSNYMYNYLAERVGLNYSHVKFKIPSKNKDNLKLAIQSIKVLGMRGANITLPYKIEAIKYLDKIDRNAALIGAINTILNKKNKLIGYNTDGFGAISAIEKHLKKVESNDKIVVLGAGGAARAVVFELITRTKNLTIINREIDFLKAKRLQADLKKINEEIKILPLNNKNLVTEAIKANFIINATSVGMWPKIEKSLLSESHFAEINEYSAIKNKYFFDVVFNPYLTKFLLAAKRYRARVCSGLYMLIYQGIKSFKIWTGKDISDKDIKQVFNLLRKKLYA